MSHLLPDSLPQGKRSDGENLQDVLSSRGYKVITRKSELKNSHPIPEKYGDSSTEAI